MTEPQYGRKSDDNQNSKFYSIHLNERPREAKEAYVDQLQSELPEHV